MNDEDQNKDKVKKTRTKEANKKTKTGNKGKVVRKEDKNIG